MSHVSRGLFHPLSRGKKNLGGQQGVVAGDFFFLFHMYPITFKKSWQKNHACIWGGSGNGHIGWWIGADSFLKIDGLCPPPQEEAKIIKAEILSTRMKQNVFPDKDDWSLSFWLSVNQSRSIRTSMPRKPTDQRRLWCALPEAQPGSVMCVGNIQVFKSENLSSQIWNFKW